MSKLQDNKTSPLRIITVVVNLWHASCRRNNAANYKMTNNYITFQSLNDDSNRIKAMIRFLL
jgi:hypothetical protein